MSLNALSSVCVVYSLWRRTPLHESLVFHHKFGAMGQLPVTRRVCRIVNVLNHIYE